MEAVRAERKRLVQQLSKVAVDCGLQRLRDDVGRQKVKTFAETIQASQGSSERKQEAAEVLAAYELTWAQGSAPAVAAEPEVQTPPADSGNASQGIRMRGTSFLLTYNWKFFSRPLPDGTPALESEDDLWKLWRRWKKKAKKSLSVTQSSSTLERSVKSKNKGRVHFHWKLNLKKGVDQIGTQGFQFHGIKPDVRVTTVPNAAGMKKPRGASFIEASNRGHFYTWAPKVGTVYSDANWKAWGNYRVLGKWLDDLWTDGKLAHTEYHDLALRVRVGFAGRKRDLEQVLAAEKDARVDALMVEVASELDTLKAPFLTFPEVAAWEETFLTLDFRWKILALVADSASGKSSFAENLFSNPFVLTVEDSEHLDLRSFDRESHDGVVLDNVNSWGQLLGWRAVLQSRNAKTTGGKSATNLYAYTQYLFGVPVVATVDLDAPDAYLVDEQHEEHSKWLCKNCVFVRLPAKGTFYNKARVPKVKIENTFSLFARTLKRRRAEAAQA